MFTLNLKELKLNPAITEDKVFNGEDREQVASDAADYIETQYKDIYNPVTVERVTRDAVRDQKGETQKEQWAREDAESRAEVKAQVAADEKLRKDVWEKYKPDIKKNSAEEWDKITAVQTEYEAKMKGVTDDAQRSQLQDEMNLKIDDIKLEYRKKNDEVEKKINQESKRDWVK